MKRPLLLFTVFAALLLAAPVFAQPPGPGPNDGSSAVADAPTPPAPTEAEVAAAASPGGEPANPRAAPDEEAERLKIWNSPPMRQARAWLVEHAELSARIEQKKDVQRQLAAVQGMSASEMRAYLKEFNQRMAALKHGQAAASAARATAVSQALERQRKTREAFANFNAGQTRAANLMRDRLGAQLESKQIADAIRADRSERALMMLQPNYNPFAPTFDPASPNAYTRRAAAASLPGDLPRGDPRNSAVDVIGVDGPGAGTVILEGGGTVPNVGGQSGTAEGGAAPE